VLIGGLLQTIRRRLRASVFKVEVEEEVATISPSNLFFSDDVERSKLLQNVGKNQHVVIFHWTLVWQIVTSVSKTCRAFIFEVK
jgi:hypothetical protein